MKLNSRITQLEKQNPSKVVKLVFIQTDESKEEVMQRDGIDENDPTSQYIFIQFVKAEPQPWWN